LKPAGEFVHPLLVDRAAQLFNLNLTLQGDASDILPLLVELVTQILAG
jgi:hypothetical protein